MTNPTSDPYPPAGSESTPDYTSDVPPRHDDGLIADPVDYTPTRATDEYSSTPTEYNPADYSSTGYTSPDYVAPAATSTDYTSTDYTSTGSTSTEPSTKDVAADQAGELKDTAVDAAQQVAGTAKNEASQVVSEAKNQASSLLGSVTGQVKEQAGTQQQRIASSVHSLSKELGSMASNSDESGPLTDLAHQASQKGGEIAHWLQDHEPGEVLDQVKRFARRRPVAFLLLCGAAGVVAGRLTRGAVAANTEIDSPSASSDSSYSSTPALPSQPYATSEVDTAPAVVAPTMYDSAPEAVTYSSDPASFDPAAPVTGDERSEWAR